MKTQFNKLVLIAFSTLALFSTAIIVSAAADLKYLLQLDFRSDLLTAEKSSFFKSDDYAPQAVFNVTTTAGIFDGVCDANCSLRDAIYAANQNGVGPDVINVPAGIYTLAQIDNGAGGDASGLPLVETNIEIIGASRETTVIERSSAGGVPAFRLFKTLSPHGTVNVAKLTLRNLTVRGGSADFGGAVFNSSPFSIGGGFNSTSSMSAYNCRFTNNSAGQGGAINAENGTGGGNFIFEDSEFTNNSASGSGGAISGGGSTFAIRRSQFVGNTAGANGGALSIGCGNCATTLEDLLVAGNQAGQTGGGLSGNSLTVRRSTFANNLAAGGSGGGLGVNNSIIENSRVLDNLAGNSGGGLSLGGTSSVTNSIIARNQSLRTGGGVQQEVGTTTIQNSTISGNSALGQGGGINASNGNGAGIVNLNGVTVTNNRAGAGGGLHKSYNTDDVVFKNSIIAGNNSPDGADLRPSNNSPFTTQGNNLVGDANGLAAQAGDVFGSSNAPVNARLSPLAFNGGQTETHALLSNSPAVGNAANTAPINDQRGRTRPNSGKDTGAFELDASAATGANAFSVSKSAASVGLVGVSFNYTIAATNNSDLPAAVTITDALPANLTFVSAQTTQGNCADSGGAITCNLGTLAANETAIVTLRVTPTATGAVVNTAVLTSGASAAQSSATVFIREPLRVGGASVCTLIDAITAANTNAPAGGCPAGSFGEDTIFLAANTTVSLTAINNNTEGETGLPVVTEALKIRGASRDTSIIERGSGAPEMRLFYTQAPLAFENLTIRNGRLTIGNPQGGAVRTFHGRAFPVTVDNCKFNDNYSAYLGGAIFAQNLIVRDSVFHQNTSAQFGGAIHVSGSGGGALIVERSQFTNNSALNYGGAISANDGIFSQISDSTFTSNSSANGGAIDSVGTTIIRRSTFAENFGTVNGASGAAINANQGRFDVFDSVFNHNLAQRTNLPNNGVGGAINVEGAVVRVYRSSFTNNIANEKGGAIRQYDDTPPTQIFDSTFSGNSAQFGGAFFGNRFEIYNSTFTGNTATVQGGAIYKFRYAGSFLNNVTIADNTAGAGGGVFHRNDTCHRIAVANSVVARNRRTDNTPDDFYVQNNGGCLPAAHGIESNGYNLIGGALYDFAWTNQTGDQIGTLQNLINPALGLLADNGGATLTRSLLAGSPAIDAGNPATPDGSVSGILRACESADQRGVIRGETGSTGRCDTGAFESNFNAMPQISISDAQTIGGNAVFTVSLTSAAGVSVSVNYATQNGTATAGTDYTTTAGTLNFGLNETLKTIEVPLLPNTADEPNENFFVNLSSPNPAGATIVDGQGEATIFALSVFKLSSPTYSAMENQGTISVTIQRTQGVGTASVTLATANGTATAGEDYTAIAPVIFTFSGSETTKTQTVTIINDTLDEPDETFSVALSNPSTNAALGTPATATVTIQDDDGAPAFSIADQIKDEGNAGTSPMTFTVTLSAASGQAAAVNYVTANDSAIAPGDYSAASGTLNFAPGETSKTFNITINGDTLREVAAGTNPPGELFFINLSGAVNASINDGNAVGNIKNDDWIADVAVSLAEADNQDPVNAGTTFAYRITLLNNGPDTAAEAHTILPFPANATLEFPLPPGCTSGQNPLRIFCTAYNLENGASRSFDVGLTPHGGIVPRPMTATTQIIASIPDDPNAANNSDSETTTIVQNAANLSLAGADSPDPVNINSTVTYTFTAGNSGPGNALGVHFKIVLPDGFTNVAASAPNSICTVTNTRIVNCAANQQSSFLAPNASRNFTVTATAPNKPGTAAVDAEVEAYYSTTKKTARVETRIRGNADLVISSANASPDTVFVGQRMTFDFNVRNQGVTDALDSRLVFPLPPNTNFDGGSSGCTFKSTSNQVTCTLGTIQPNGLMKRLISIVPQAAAVTFPTLPNNPPRVSGTATATSLDDTNNANNSATVSRIVSDAADLIVTHTSSIQQVFADADIEYVIRVRNNGLSIARNVSVVSSKPPALNYVGAGAVVDNNGGSCIRENAQVRCNLGTILSGAEKIARVTVRTAQPGIYTNTASATAATADLNPSNNSRKATVQITNSAFAADVRVGSFTATNNAPRVEDAYDLSLTAANDGPNAANDVFVRTNFGDGAGELELVSAQNGTIQDGEAAFNLGTLAVNESRTVTVRVKAVREGIAPVFGRITTSNGDGNTANNQTNSSPTIAPKIKGDLAVMASIPIFQKKELDLGLLVPRPQLASGLHTVVVKNLGSFNVTGAVLTAKNYAIKGQNVNISSLNGSIASPVASWIRLDNSNNPVAAGVCGITLGGSEFPTLVRDPQTIFSCQVGTIPVGHTVTFGLFYDVVREAIGFGIIRISANEFDPNLLNNESTIFAPPNTDNTSSDGSRPFSSQKTEAVQAVALNLGAALITFAEVSAGGTTTIEQISADNAGTMPGGFTVVGGNLAYDIKTTATVVSPIDVCFPISAVGDAASFNRLNILHNENGQLIDRTFSRDFTAKMICARTDSLGSFILAQQVDPTLLLVSGKLTKNGVAVGNAQVRIFDLANAAAGSVNLQTVTDAEGNYRLVNLLPNRNYVIMVFYDNHISTPSQTTFNNLTANQTADFSLAPSLPAPTSAVEFSQTAYTVNENGGSAIVTVTRSGNLSSAATAIYQITGNSAQDSSDFQAANGMVNFAANETTKTISITIVNDAFNEPSETFAVSLQPLAGSSTVGANGAAIVTINDDDPLPTLTVANAGFTEGNAGTSFAVFDVSLSAASNQAVSAIYTTIAGTAAPGSDYTETTAIITIPAGAGGGTVLIPVLGDTVIEMNETFTVSLSDPANAAIFAANAVGTIVNDDFAPTAANVTISGSVLTLTGEGVPQARVTITDTNGASQTILSGKFGRFKFREVAAGGTYILSVGHRRYRFNPQILNVTEDVAGIILRAEN